MDTSGQKTGALSRYEKDNHLFQGVVGACEMKAIYITLLLAILTGASIAQNKQPVELGIGFVIPADPYGMDAQNPEYLYSDKELSTKIITKSVDPFFYKPDYGLFHFICLEKTTKYYKVLINNTETAFIINNKSFRFKSWEAVLLQSSVERLTKDNPILIEPVNNTKVISNNCKPDLLNVEDVVEKNGEYWLQISFLPNCEEYKSKDSQVTHGWVKWRIKNKLLVNILLLC